MHDPWELENRLYDQGYQAVCGVDEAGSRPFGRAGVRRCGDFATGTDAALSERLQEGHAPPAGAPL